MNYENSKSKTYAIISFVIGITIAAFLIFIWPFATVPTGYRGVITTFGKPEESVKEEGIHFLIPVAQKMNTVNVSIQRFESGGDAASKDLQSVTTTVALNYHVDPKSVVSVFRDLFNEPERRIIDPAIHEAVKAVTAEFTAEELVSKRPKVRDMIVLALQDKLHRHGIIIDEFSIMNFRFSESFNQAIEAKTTAEQLKLKAERDLQRIQVEAEQKIAGAKAEAESLRLQKQEITPEMIQLRQTENQKLAIEKWNGVLPTYSGNAVPFISFK